MFKFITKLHSVSIDRLNFAFDYADAISESTFNYDANEEREAGGITFEPLLIHCLLPTLMQKSFYRITFDVRQQTLNVKC